MATIRYATVDDLDAFCSMFDTVAAEGIWIGTEAPIDWSARRPMIEASVTDPDKLVVLAVDDLDAPIGWIVGDHGAHGRVDLFMGLLDAHRSQGLGTQLMAALLGWAKQRGAHKVCLELWPHNDRARGLYEKFGFVVEGNYRRHWRRNDGSLWDATAMSLVLDEDAPGSPYESR